MNILINGYITQFAQEGYPETSLTKVMARLEGIEPSEVVNVMIESYGGEVDAGFAIVDYLTSLPNVVNTVVLNAQSIASVIAQANANGGKRYITRNGKIMIHLPFGEAVGNSSDFQDMATELVTIENDISTVYAAKSGVKTQEEFLQLMKKETIFGANEAIKLGLADEIYNENRNFLKTKLFLNSKTSMNWLNKIKGMIKNDLALTSVDGQEIVIVTELDAPAVGDPITVNAEAGNGTYTLADGSIVVAVDGIITEITAPEVAPEVAPEIMARMEAIEGQVTEMKAAVELLVTNFASVTKVPQRKFDAGVQTPAVDAAIERIKEKNKLKK